MPPEALVSVGFDVDVEDAIAPSPGQVSEAAHATLKKTERLMKQRSFNCNFNIAANRPQGCTRSYVAMLPGRRRLTNMI